MTSEKFHPSDYQQDGIRHLMRCPHAGIFMDPGLGKTATTLAAFQLLRRKGFVGRMLVICPLLPAYEVWPAETTKWSDFHDLRVRVLHGAGKTTAALNEEAEVYAINFDGLPWLDRHLDDWRYRPDMLVIDESSKVKNPRTQRFSILAGRGRGRRRAWLPLFNRRVILTGTPAPRSYEDLFGQIYCLDLGDRLGKYITHYRHQYFMPGGFGNYEWFLQPGAADRINEQISDIVLHVSDEVLGLPPPVINQRTITMPAKAKKAYDDLEREFVAELEDGLITARNAGSKTTKLRQAANGGLYDDDGRIHELHDAKTEDVKDLVDELQGTPLLVAFQFRQDRERLLKAFPDAPVVDGDTTPASAREILAAFNRGEVPVLLAQPQAMGHGLNLQQGCHTVYWYGLPYDFEAYHQLNKRVHRRGQRHRVVIHHGLARDTLDWLILDVLAGKRAGQQTLLNAVKHAYGVA